MVEIKKQQHIQAPTFVGFFVCGMIGRFRYGTRENIRGKIIIGLFFAGMLAWQVYNEFKQDKSDDQIFHIITFHWVGLVAIKNQIFFWEGLILNKGKKVKYVEIGGQVVLYKKNSAEYAVLFKIKGVTKDKIKLHRNDNG